jgi:peptidoglycan/LPS O-acetylase OafA/YrhL
VIVPRPSAREAANPGHTAERSAPDGPASLRVGWLDPLKGFAILAVLLNHLVESFGPGPWFTDPSSDWPDLATRLHTFFPHDHSRLVAFIRFLGWLGDSAPGVFLFASGVGLTLAAAGRVRDPDTGMGGFYRRRLARLYPLYIAMHFVVLGLALAIPGDTLSFASPMTMASLTGFRGLPSLFYYIAPAWWYVWLIIQLYLLYPFLLRWLDRSGPALFFVGTLAITIASRAFGMLFWERLHIHLYMWMTGLLALTRLAEFTAGMVVARGVIAARQAGRGEPGLWPSMALSVAIYVAGLACSLTLAGSLLSNLLVSLGLSGLFYCAWRAMRDHVPGLAAVIASAGVSSYAIYLVHHPLLIWTGVFLPGDRPLHLCAAVLALVVSVPVGRFIERTTDAVADRGPAWLIAHSDALSMAAGGATFVLLIAVEPLLGPRGGRAVGYLIACSTAVALWLEWLRRSGAPRGGPAEPDVCAVVRRIGLASGLLGLFIMPPGTGYLAATAGVVIGVVATAAHSRGTPPRRLWTAWSAGIVVTLLIAAGAEWGLRIVAPREIGGWGERPALMIHPTRAFALIPNRTTHLRYNDYDYVVRTNGLGLASPEIPAARPTANTLRVLTTGDAFTMPEGLNFEQSFPALLDSALARCLTPRPVQVINAGVTGYGPREEEPQFDELGAIFHPDIVVHEFFVNDWSDIMVGAEERRDGIGLTRRHLTRGALFDRSDLVANARLLYERVISGLTGRISNTQRYKLLLDYYRTGPNPLYDTVNTDRMARFIAHFRDAARADGGTLIIFFTPGGVTVLPRDQIAYLPRSGIPLTDSVDYDLRRPLTALEHITDSLGVPVVDLTGPLRAYRPQPVYFPNQWHWTAAGHRAAAAAILAALGRQGLIPQACAS